VRRERCEGGGSAEPAARWYGAGEFLELSGEDFFDDVAVDVGEAVVAAGVVEGEAFVIEAHEVEDGGVEVVDVDAIGGDADPVFVGLAVGDAGFDACACEP